MSTRPPAVAGVFYPSGPSDLAAAVDSLLCAADACATAGAGPDELDGADEPDAADAVPLALVVPHAGYVYSGPVAATAYALLRPHADRVRRIVMLGPSHYVSLAGTAAPTTTRWATPLGELDVEPAPGVHADDAPHAQEHCLEVQLPFLQRLLRPGFVVIPIAVGRTDADDVADLLDEIGLSRPDLVVVSTDLSHYHDVATATRLDRRTADAVIAGDLAAIGPDTACGSWALRGLLAHVARHGRAVRLLDLRTSADTAGDPRRVVGYGAFAVTGRRAATTA